MQIITVSLGNLNLLNVLYNINTTTSQVLGKITTPLLNKKRNPTTPTTEYLKPHTNNYTGTEKLSIILMDKTSLVVI